MKLYMIKSLLLVSCIYLSAFALTPKRNFVSQDELISAIEQSDEPLAYIPDDIMGIIVRHGSMLHSMPSESLHDLHGIITSGVDAAELKFLDFAVSELIVLLDTDPANTNDVHTLQEYKKALESGDALLEIKEDNDIRGKKHKKIYCSLVVQRCIQAGHLTVVGSATINQNLAVKGTITSCDTIQAPELLIRPCSTTRAPSNPGCIAFENSAGDEQARVCSYNDPSQRFSISVDEGVTPAFVIDSNGNVTAEKGLTVRSNSGAPVLYVNPNTNQVFVNGIPISGGGGGCSCSNFTLIPAVGNQSCIQFYEANGITLKGAMCSSTVAGDKGLFISTDGIIENLRITNAGNVALSNALQLQDSSGINYAGLKAPTTVPTSYTLVLPGGAPTAGQVLFSGSVTPTDLEWRTPATTALPSTSKVIYVSKAGNDTTGNGSSVFPYATLSKAVNLANSFATSTNPVIIYINPGIYVEDNSAGPITITADGISITGGSPNSAIIRPSTLSNNLIATTHTVYFASITLDANGVSTAAGVALSGATNNSFFQNVNIQNFNTGVTCSSVSGLFVYTFNLCNFVNNTTGISGNNAILALTGCQFQGANGLPNHTGINVTGSGARLNIRSCNFFLHTTGITLSSSAHSDILSSRFSFNTFDIIQTTASIVTLNGCTFAITTGTSDIKIQVSDAGTDMQLSACMFNGKNSSGVPNGTAVKVVNEAKFNAQGGEFEFYTTALQIGDPGDTSSTQVLCTGTLISDCTNDIVQNGSSRFAFTAASASANKISINDATNVKMAFFDQTGNNALNIGNFADMDTDLIRASVGPDNLVQFDYRNAIYGTKSMGYNNFSTDPTSLFTIGTNDTNLTASTTDRAKTASLNLISDTASPVGTTTALRGWNITKDASSAELSFNYQNSDLSGQSNIPEYTVMQLDGANNQMHLPNTGTKMMLGGDTSLYRSSGALLKTDGNLIVGGLTGNRAIATNASSELISSATTDTELGFLSGTTSSVQTQLNAKVDKSGSTMTGRLTLPAGSAASPSLQFSSSTNTGLSVATANILALSTLGIERMNIDASGNVTINGLNAAGVAHTNASGTLSTSQVVNTDIANATITNAKLAAISSANTSGNIVVRDGSGNFDATMITLSGAVTNPTDAATKSYVDSAISTGLVAKTPALVTSDTNIVLSGLQTIDGVLLVANDRVLLTGQTSAVQNGLWLAQAGVWTRPTDFNTGDLAGQAYVLITSGTTWEGSAWLCNTPTAFIDTDPIEFVLFSLPDTTTAANVGTGAGHIFRNKTGNTLNLKTIAAGTHITVTNNANDIALTTDATNANTASTIVARDGSGNFSAGTITASLTGAASLNVLKNGDTMTGALQIPAGTAALPSLRFTSSTTTGLSAATADTLVLSTAATERLKISSTGTVTIDSLTPTAGVVHNNSSGDLSSSLIVNADIHAAAGIVDTKLATIATAGKVSNAATTATDANTASAIVARDASGNFTASTISATLFNGPASDNVLKAGDTMTGALQLPAGTTAAPSLHFTGSSTAGLSASSDNLSLSTNAIERVLISSAGTVAIKEFATPGVVHNDASGNLSTSLIVNADINAAAAIADTKLATISTAGKVSNSATTATSANNANTIVLRDASGDFSAGTITATLNGTASGSLPLSGGTLTGNLTLPAGTAAAPSLNFTGSTTTGLSAATTDTLSLSTNAAERMKISSTGTVSINGFTSGGVVHNDALGELSSSLIVNADIHAAAAIADTKLATISTAGKVSNSATTATSANTASAIVSRDGSGNFSAETITANLTGTASGNLPNSGGTLSGTLTLPAGTTAVPSLQFSGSTDTGISASGANVLSLSTNATERLRVSATGAVSINAFLTPGVVHNSPTGVLSSSLIVNADVDAAAAIADTKLATISTAGKVLNSATTATDTNTAGAIVARNILGNFTAGTITAALTGAASLNVLKAGDTMTGPLTLPVGSAAAPSLRFTGSTTTGLSAASANTLSLDANGVEAMNLTSTDINLLVRTIAKTVLCNQGLETFTITANAQTFTTAGTTSILLMLTTATRTGIIVNFPPNPTNGQYFTIILGATGNISVTFTSNGGTGGAIVANAITQLNPTNNLVAATGGSAVTYFYVSATNTWYRAGRG